MAKWPLSSTLILFLAGVTVGLKLHVPPTIVAKYGSTISIPCSMSEIDTFDRYSSQDLIWYFNDNRLNQHTYAALNETTSELTLTDITLDETGNYTCAVEGSIPGHVDMATTVVTVGTEPGVDNFTCVSHNIVVTWCTWDPLDSHLPTEYEFSYRPYGSLNQWSPCPNNSVAKEETSCYFGEDVNLDFKYRMKVTAINALDKTSDEIWFTPNTDTVPHPPENLQVINRDQYSLDIKWDPPSDWKQDSYFLDFRLKYYSEWEEGRWTQSEMISIKNDKTVNGLEANTLYYFRVSCKLTGISEADWSPWSVTASGRTSESAPSRGVQLYLSHDRTNVDNTRDVTMEWTLPPRRMRNGVIIGYNITVKEERNPTNTLKWNIEDGNITVFTIPDINRYSSYQVTVIAFNSVGSSPPASFRILDEASAPSAPVITSVNATSEDTIAVSWDPPESTNGNIVAYMLAYTVDDGILTEQKQWHRVTVDGNVQSYHVQDLKAFVRYEFKIQSQNSFGYGGYSQTIAQYTMEGVPSGPPVNLTLQAIPESPSSLSAKWTPPNLSDRNGIILAYQITACPPQKQFKLTDIVDGDVSTRQTRPIMCTGNDITRVNVTVMEPHSVEASVLPLKYIIRGLSPNTEYDVSISAMTAIGVGPGSEFARTKTSMGAPARPIDVEILEEMVSGSALTVRWSMPGTIEDDVSHYEITVKPQNNSKHCHDQIVNTTNTRVRIEDLCGYETYEVKVKACSIAVIPDPCGEYSDPVYATTLIGVPSQPVDVKATPIDDSTIKVTWLPPERPNGPMDELVYIIECYSGDDIISEGQTVGVTEMLMSARCETDIATDAVKVTCQVQSSLNRMNSPSGVSNDIEICYEKAIWPYVVIVIGVVLGVIIMVLLVVCCYRFAVRLDCLQQVSHVKPLWEEEPPSRISQDENREVFDSMPVKKANEVDRRASFRTLLPQSRPKTETKRTFLQDPCVTGKGPRNANELVCDAYISMEAMGGNGAACQIPRVRSPLSPLDEYQTVADVRGRNILLSGQSVPSKVHVPADGMEAAEVDDQPQKSSARANISSEEVTHRRKSDMARKDNLPPESFRIEKETGPSESCIVEGYIPLESTEKTSSADAVSAASSESSLQSIGSCEANHSGLKESIDTLLGNSLEIDKPNIAGAVKEGLPQRYLPLDFVQQGHDDVFNSGSTVASNSTFDGSDHEDVENTVPLLKRIPGYPYPNSSPISGLKIQPAALNNQSQDNRQVSGPIHGCLREADVTAPSATGTSSENGALNRRAPVANVPSSPTRRDSREKPCVHPAEDYQLLVALQPDSDPAEVASATSDSTSASDNMEDFEGLEDCGYEDL